MALRLRVCCALTACALSTGCGSSQPSPPDDIVPLTTAAPASATPAGGTKIADIAAVDAHGNPAVGWSVDNSEISRTGVDCSDNDASPSAPAGNIYACAPSSARADACWIAADRRHVLCLASPESRTLIELTPDAMPTGDAKHIQLAEPILLDLDNGDRCRVRNGGSWDPRPADPDLAGTYSCTKAEAVWSAQFPGIDKSTKTWTVRTGNPTGSLTQHAVTVAYFVAIAGP